MNPDYLALKISDPNKFRKIILLPFYRERYGDFGGIEYNPTTLQLEYIKGTDPFLSQIVQYNHFWFDYANEQLSSIKFRDYDNLPLRLDGIRFSDWREVFLAYSENSREYAKKVSLANIKHFREIRPDYEELKKNPSFLYVLNLTYEELEIFYNARINSYINELIIYDDFWYDYINKHLPWARTKEQKTPQGYESWYDYFLAHNRKETFLDVLPNEMFNSILLQVDLDQILPTLQNICTVYPAKCLDESNLWIFLYRRDFDEEIPKDVKEVYLNLAELFNRNKGNMLRFHAAAVNGAYNTLIKLPLPEDEVDLQLIFEEAIQKSTNKVLKYLIDSGVKINQRSLYIAARTENIEIADYLIRKGIKVDDNTLKIAIEHKKPAMVKFLIEKGANKLAKGILEKAVLYMPNSKETYEIVKILLESNDKAPYDNNLLFSLAHNNKNVDPEIASKIGSYVYYD